jgi:chitin synthase
MSARSKRESKLAEQIKALGPLLDSFGNAKTLLNPNASRHGRFFELHFNERGRVSGAKVLAYGLDKSRLTRLMHEERTYHVFYQLLAGASPEERDRLQLEDPSDYALLASSGCYRLPSGPFSDDSIAMADLRAAMRTLGFKAKHISAICSLLHAILLLGNIQFGEGDHRDVSAYVANTLVLEQVAGLLGVPADELAQILTNKTSYVRKELYTVLLDARGSSAQRDQFVRDLYSIMFAFVVEHANHRIAPGTQDPPPHTQIILLDHPGFQSRSPTGTASMMFNAPLVSVHGANSFDEFAANFADELVQSYIVRNTFGDGVGINGQLTSDGIALPAIATMDNAACVELLRGAALSERAQRKPGGMIGIMNKACSAFRSGKASEHKDEEMLQDLVAKFGVHGSFVASPGVGGVTDRNLFGINHYAGSCSYDVSGFIEKDTDIVDPSFVTLLRTSSESFVAKLFSGPSLAAERHSKDETIIVQAQVSSRPLRQPTPVIASDGSAVVPGDEFTMLDPSKVYPVTTQLNHNISEILRHLDRTRLWTVSCIRPNDSGSPNSFDKRRVKAQIRALLLPDVVARKQSELAIDYEQSEFCERYVPTMRGSEAERIRQCASSNGWREGVDYALGHRSIWLAYNAWKDVEDSVRAGEQDSRKNSGEAYEEDEPFADDATEYTQQDGGAPDYYDQSAENVGTRTRSGPGGAAYHSPGNAGGYGFGGMPSPQVDRTPAYSEADDTWDSSWDKKGANAGTPAIAPELSKEGSALIVNQAPAAAEEVPTTRIRRGWLWLVWLMTWWIPTFTLTKIGRMKRPDVRLAWREKMTIFLLIFLFNAIVIFYIVEFGRLLCPDFDKAWSISEVGGHSTDDNYWVAIQGWVYDVSKFVHGDHSDISGQQSNTADILDALAGQDLTGYFPVPLTLACPDLVDDAGLKIESQTFNPITQIAVHTSGSQQSVQGTALDASDWYTARFLPKIKQYRKGPLVIASSKLKSEGSNDTSTK